MADVPSTLTAAESATIQVCRSARLTAPTYHFYRDLLLTFVHMGATPDTAHLNWLATQHGVPLAATLAGLAAADLVQCDKATGAITAAYPFSGLPTMHTVVLTDERDPCASNCVAATPAAVPVQVQLFAMCALDALGIPLMLGRAGAITSRDALTGEPIAVALLPDPGALAGPRPLPLSAWHMTWQSTELVLVVRPEEHEAEHAAGTCIAEGTCCPVTNFFSNCSHAVEWLAHHPESDGQMVTPDEGLSRAHALFAGVLDRESAPEQERKRERNQTRERNDEKYTEDHDAIDD